MINDDESVRSQSIADILFRLDESNTEESKVLKNNATLKYTLNHFLRGLGSPKHSDRMYMANCLSQVSYMKNRKFFCCC